MSTTTTFYAEMSCGGCSGAITRILSKMDGVEKVECEAKPVNKVVVTSSTPIAGQAYLDAIAAWATAAGKQTSLTPIA